MSVQDGVFITFFDDVPGAEDLPALGPIHDLVVRQTGIIAERALAQPGDHIGDVARWLEAELEFQRATGNEPGGPRRRALEVRAPAGLFIRFGSYGDPRERDAVPDLGPFATVSIRPGTLEADGETLAVRSADGSPTWQLTESAGPQLAARTAPDVAFRTRSTTFHPALTAMATSASRPSNDAARPSSDAPQRAPARVEQPEPREQDSDALAHVERERLADVARVDAEIAERQRAEANVKAAFEATRTFGQRQRGPVVDAAADDALPPTEHEASSVEPGWRGLLWRARFVVLAVLAIGVLLVGLNALRGGGASALRTIEMGDRLSVASWDYTVDSATRAAAAGSVIPRGSWLVVRVTAVNHGDADRQVAVSSFEVIDDAGRHYSPEPSQSNVYATTGALVWPTSFPNGRAVSVPLVFDVSNGAAGLRLVIQGASEQVRLN